MDDPTGDPTDGLGRANRPLPIAGDGTAAHAQPKQDKGRDPRGTTPSP